MPLSIGEKAPQFTLKTKDKAGLKDWSFPEKLNRPLVLLFFPAAFSQICTGEFCHVGFHGLKSLKMADVVAISTDSPFSQEAWCEEYNIEVSMLSDYDHKVIQLYDVVLPDLLGLGPCAARAAFVVDTEGIIRYSEQPHSPMDIPDFNAIKKCVKELEESNK